MKNIYFCCCNNQKHLWEDRESMNFSFLCQEYLRWQLLFYPLTGELMCFLLTCDQQLWSWVRPRMMSNRVPSFQSPSHSPGPDPRWSVGLTSLAHSSSTPNLAFKIPLPHFLYFKVLLWVCNITNFMLILFNTLSWKWPKIKLHQGVWV